MRRVGACPAVAASIAAALLVSACAVKPPQVRMVTAPAFPRPPEPPQYPEPVTPAGVHAEDSRWFSAAGYQPFQAAALAQHARIESGYHPCIAGAAGLATPTSGAAPGCSASISLPRRAAARRSTSNWRSLTTNCVTTRILRASGGPAANPRRWLPCDAALAAADASGPSARPWPVEGDARVLAERRWFA